MERRKPRNPQNKELKRATGCGRGRGSRSDKEKGGAEEARKVVIKSMGDSEGRGRIRTASKEKRGEG